MNKINNCHKCGKPAEMMRVSDGSNDLYYVRCTDTKVCQNRSEVVIFPIDEKFKDPTMSFLNPLIEEWNEANPVSIQADALDDGVSFDEPLNNK